MAKHAQEGAEENSLNLMKGNIKNPQSNSLIEKAFMLSPQGQKQAEESYLSFSIVLQVLASEIRR